MKSSRIEELMKQTAYPESNSVYQAMLQLWNEMSHEFNSRTCESCMYYNENIPLYGEHEGKCSNYITEERDFGTVTLDFSCNKWEVRDENK